jgi:short-subunit dehydrogenase
MLPWHGKWALVTGASAGIGHELARQLAAGGANLVLTARRTERLSQLAAELAGQHQIRVEIFPADLTRPQAPEEIFHFAQENNLPIEVLINNAGFGAAGEFRAQDSQRLLEMVQVNVASVVNLTHLFVPAMVERRSGYVMIVSSTAAFQSVPYLCVYGATKGFDLLFAEGISEELRQYGVRVTALCPGSTASEFHQVAGRPAGGGTAPPEKVARDGLRALAAGKSLVISGLGNRLAMETQRLVPRRLVTRAVGRMYRLKT